MATYYGVERSSEYLKHDGVKGMRWGVRKALDRHYKKAKAKLAKLKSSDVKQTIKDGLIAGAIGAVGGLGAANAYTAYKVAEREVMPNSRNEKKRRRR